MRESTFYILLNMKTCEGLESFGRFFIGKSKKFAETLFSQLKGDKNVNEGSILHLELRETSNGLPVNMHIISCTLEELVQNCKTITKETFKFINLE
jgi:hypothetical protein